MGVCDGFGRSLPLSVDGTSIGRFLPLSVDGNRVDGNRDVGALIGRFLPLSVDGPYSVLPRLVLGPFRSLDVIKLRFICSLSPISQIVRRPF